MSRIAVIYWSGTGHTEEMARAVADGARTAGAEADIFRAEDFSAGMAADYDVQAWGCPAQGEEMVEQDVFWPLFGSCAEILRDKQVALFGSHGQGDGTFMMEWEDACDDMGIELAAESVICREKPDAAALAGCYELGHRLARLAKGS